MGLRSQVADAPTHTVLRALLVGVLVCSSVGLAVAYEPNTTVTQPDAPATVASSTPLNGTTVATSQSGALYLYDTAGDVLMVRTNYDTYWDVDRLPGTRSVLVSVADKASGEQCDGPRQCTRNSVLRLNLTTGETTELYDLTAAGHDATEIHDVDRVDDDLLLADMAHNRVVRVDSETGIIEWSWDAESFYSHADGGRWPEDWLHINDVELLSDGRIMVSPRNTDSVLFLNESTGVVDSWTLGADDDLTTLYEQHNPDYIPASRGGPAVVVADSENDRVVEYQRENGEWVQSWVWADSPLSWPRDADRLPSGNTLVADTYGDRVVEVNTNGEVVWSVPAPFVYDAERLGTGDESAGGHSAAALGLASDASATDPEAGEATLSDLIKAQFPPRLIHGLQSVTPFWMGIGAFALLLTWVGSLCGLVVVEFRYRDHGIRLRSPVTREQSRDCERVSNEE